jgi:hypothetical protein
MEKYPGMEDESYPARASPFLMAGCGACGATGVITTNTFRFNKGQNGGTLWLNAIKKISLDNNVVANGTADKGSGGLEINQCNADIGFCSFLSQKGDKGGAIYAQVSFRKVQILETYNTPNLTHNQTPPCPSPGSDVSADACSKTYYLFIIVG